MSPTYLQPADIVFVQSPGLFSRLQRKITQRGDEPPSWASHTRLISVTGQLQRTLRRWIPPWCIEALVRKGVVEHEMPPAKPGQKIAIARPTNLPPGADMKIVRTARKHVGDKYTRWALLFHYLHVEKWMPRRLAELVRICSRETGWSYDEVLQQSYGALGYTFGKPAHQLTPDDIFDFCAREASKPDGKYVWVVPPWEA